MELINRGALRTEAQRSLRPLSAFNQEGGVVHQLKHLKAYQNHLMENWNVAQEWRYADVASNGAPCFILFSASGPVYKRLATGEFGQLTVIGTQLYGQLCHGGKEAARLWLEREIAKAEEFEAAPLLSPSVHRALSKVPALVGVAMIAFAFLS